ncbi:MAG: BrnT family toxin [Bradymonadales bacterium]|nr:MAG: BrnT family toxin [Bradymonadales bacterium]
MLQFEWDPKKSNANKKKHGVSFKEAIQLWNGPHLTVDSIAKSEDGEERGATIGFLANELYTAIWTKRKNKRRLISVRRSRDGEKKVFWNKIQNF